MLLNYHIGRFVLGSLCVGDLVRLGLSNVRVAGWSTSCASACNTDTTQTQPHQISNTQRTENKTTDMVIQQHSRKLLMTDILMSETCWAHKKWNTITNMPQGDSYQPVTTGPQVWTETTSCELCGGQSGTGTGFSPSTKGLLLSV